MNAKDHATPGPEKIISPEKVKDPVEEMAVLRMKHQQERAELLAENNRERLELQENTAKPLLDEQNNSVA